MSSTNLRAASYTMTTTQATLSAKEYGLGADSKAPFDDKQPSPEPDFRDADAEKASVDEDPDVPPFHPSGTPRTLQIYHTTFSRSMTVTDGAKDQPALYTVQLHHGPKAAVEVRAASGATVGAARFHHFSHAIDMHLHNAPVALESNGAFKTGWGFQSPAAAGEARTWRGMYEMVCVDATDQPRARFTAAKMSPTKLGTLEVVEGVEEKEVDEMVVTVVAMMEQRRRRRIGAKGGGNASLGG